MPFQRLYSERLISIKHPPRVAFEYANLFLDFGQTCVVPAQLFTGTINKTDKIYVPSVQLGHICRLKVLQHTSNITPMKGDTESRVP